MGNFQKYWSQNVGQDFIVLRFFCWGDIVREQKGVCGRLMSPAHETQSMREIRLLRGRLPRKGGGLTGMLSVFGRKRTAFWYNLNLMNEGDQYLVEVVQPLTQYSTWWRVSVLVVVVQEWMSDCCLTPIQQFCLAIWREQVNFQWDDDEVCLVLDQHAELDIYSASSLKQ